MKQYQYQVGQRVIVNHPLFRNSGEIVARYFSPDNLNLCYVIRFNKGFLVGDGCPIRDIPFSESFLREEGEGEDERTVTFFYEKSPYDAPKRRLIKVAEENFDYIAGIDLDDEDSYKKFLKNKIVGEIKEVK